MKIKWIIGNMLAAAMVMGMFASPTSIAGDQPRFEWKLSHTGVPTHAYHYASIAFADYVREKTNGDFIINIYHSGTLGWESDILDAMQLGTIELTLAEISPYSEYVPAYAALTLPFIFESIQHMHNTFDNMDLSRLHKQSSDAGFVDLFYAGFVFRHPINNVRQINTPSDFSGIKFRTMGVPLHIDTYKSFGANVVTTSFTELYSALQMGVVDGCENTYGSLENRKFYEVAKYVTTLPMFNSIYLMSASKIAYDKLPPEYQAILGEASKVAAEVAHKAQTDLNQYAIDVMTKNGNDFTTPDIAPFIEIVKPIRDAYLAGMEPWVREMVEDIAKYK